MSEWEHAFDKPYLLDTPEKVEWANSLNDPENVRWRLGDHCWYRPRAPLPPDKQEG